MGEDEAPPAVDPLRRLRMERITELLLENDVDSVIDLGCGDGRYLTHFMQVKQFRRIAGMDVSHKNLERVSERLHLDELHGAARGRITVFQGSLTYHDDRLKGYDAAIAVDVMEHMELSRLDSFERAVFMYLPRVVIITTSNKEYNFDEIDASHPDRRFEWTRTEFEGWALAVGMRHNYSVSISFIGEEKPNVGAASQLALFVKE
jgi:3' terminal RNA ribose 2'-O-methyltransferase Hen1